ncbi:hypothetical protein Hanom_Chr12g01178851 [Helianthus anomalus]
MEISFRLCHRRLKSGPSQDLEGGGGEAVDLDLLESGGDESGDCFGDMLIVDFDCK